MPFVKICMCECYLADVLVFSGLLQTSIQHDISASLLFLQKEPEAEGTSLFECQLLHFC